MTSVSRKVEKFLLRKQEKLMNKKGQIIGATGNTVVNVMILIFLVFAVLFGIVALNPSGFFTAGSVEANTTADLSRNLTNGIGQFGGQIPTVFKILGVVLALSAVGLLIAFISRFRGAGGGGDVLGG